MPNLADAKAAITRPIGPLPAWGWVAVVVGGFFAYKLIKGKSGGSTNTTAAVGSALPTDGTNGAIDSLTQSIQDLLGKLSNTGGGGGGGVVVAAPPIDIGGGGSSGGSGSSGGGSGSGSDGSNNGTSAPTSGPVAAVTDTIKATGTALASMTPNLPTLTNLSDAGAIEQAVRGKNFLALKSTLDTSKNTVADQLQKPLTQNPGVGPVLSIASPGTSNNLAQPSLIQDIGATAPATNKLEAVGSALGTPTITETAKVPATTPSIPAQTQLRNTGTALRNRVK